MPREGVYEVLHKIYQRQEFRLKASLIKIHEAGLIDMKNWVISQNLTQDGSSDISLCKQSLVIEFFEPVSAICREDNNSVIIFKQLNLKLA